tara:strand:+ start:37241 stop:37984 length:744 start_codon:yes stop_codon:yes gene_type:complete
MDFYEQIEAWKKDYNLNNEEIAGIIGKKGDTFRKALNRKSVSELEQKVIVDVISRYEGNETRKLSEILKDVIPNISNKKEYYPLNNADQLKETDAVWVDYSSFMNIPVVQKRAQAGFLSGWGDDEYLEELPTIPWEVDREYKGKYIAFEVTGDSMDDNSRESIIEGDTLICREIQRHHWVNKLHLHRWKNFVVVHRTEGILVKRVLKHDIDTGRLLLHSLNPLFDDQEVFMDDLIALFNVIDIHRSL